MLQKKLYSHLFCICLRLATHETIIKSKAILEMWETADIKRTSTDFLTV